MAGRFAGLPFTIVCSRNRYACSRNEANKNI